MSSHRQTENDPGRLDVVTIPRRRAIVAASRPWLRRVVASGRFAMVYHFDITRRAVAKAVRPVGALLGAAVCVIAQLGISLLPAPPTCPIRNNSCREGASKNPYQILHSPIKTIIGISRPSAPLRYCRRAPRSPVSRISIEATVRHFQIFTCPYLGSRPITDMVITSAISRPMHSPHHDGDDVHTATLAIRL